MELDKHLLHIHRHGYKDNIWFVGNQILIDENFITLFYKKILENEEILKRRYGENYNIDFIIGIMEEMIRKNVIKVGMEDEFMNTLYFYYFLRRERALEEGRKIFNPSAPCRFNSLYLFEDVDLYYWLRMVGSESFSKFLIELDGNLFVSSDIYFPSRELSLEDQVEESKEYWNPKAKKLIHKEYIFQGNAKILK